MANVRFSKQLIEEIESNIRASCQKECEALGAQGNPDSVESERLRDVLWGEHVALKNTLPVKWCQNGKGQNVVVSVDDKENYNFSTVSLYIRMSSANFLLPPHESLYNLRLKLDVTELSSFPVVCDAYHRYVAQRDIHLKWEAAKKQVTEFVRAFPTLNRAVAEWPELRLYLPDSMLKQLDTPTVPRAKTARVTPTYEAPFIDKDGLTSTAIAARMA